MRVKKVVVVSTLLLLAGSLAGCSISVVDPADAASPTTGSHSTSRPETPAPEASTSDTDDAAPSGFSAAAEERREILIAAATTTMPCPDGPLTIDGSVVRVEGSCAELVIEIDAGAVVADDVESLTLSGSGTDVYVDSVTTLTVTGSASTVLWAGATPTVHESGAANVLRKG
ncbi:DUF3060 domain-containing protein [Streptomyces sp. AC495_CC817]|uniref:DUF3060 domain-containing protein n=1 Tax=Streptomyces sp. AC495_CC817 TaxID=2823900 RepID=UPI001C25D836|nr:DUF3060 domain-containing protein [Streptomyces sp. AC495_CC817]